MTTIIGCPFIVADFSLTESACRILTPRAGYKRGLIGPIEVKMQNVIKIPTFYQGPSMRKWAQPEVDK